MNNNSKVLYVTRPKSTTTFFTLKNEKNLFKILNYITDTLIINIFLFSVQVNLETQK